jgi:hypothetical protein
MRRLLAAGLAAALFALGSCASRRGPALPEPRETGQLVLWSVASASNAQGRAWLFGSVHAAPPDLAFDPAIERGFEASDALVVELDLSQEWDAASVMLRMATLPEGRTLDQVVPPSTYRALVEFLRRRGQSTERYRDVEPWLLMTLVSASLFAEAKLSPDAGVDQRFLTRAEGRVPVIALETLEFQLSLFDSLPLGVQAHVLGAMLESTGEGRKVARRFYEAWQRGDLEALEAYTLAGTQEDPAAREFHERTYLARNRAMAERLDALLGEAKTWFVVVGAGHMVGSEGVPALLAARGHAVARVAKSAP